MIVNTVNNKCYIGSSRNILKRWSNHRYDAKHSSRPLYNDMRQFGLDKFQFSILEECSVEELKIREQYYISMLNPEYNVIKASAGISVSFSEDAKEYRRQYHQANKEAENERRRKWYEANKEAYNERRRKKYKENKLKSAE